MKNTLRIIKNEFRESKRILPECKPKALNPPRFEVELVDMRNPGVRWFYSLIKM